MHGLATFEAVSAVLSALTCCALRFVELTAVDQAAPIETYLSGVLMLASGSPGWIRTSDHPIMSWVLYRLATGK